MATNKTIADYISMKLYLTSLEQVDSPTTTVC